MKKLRLKLKLALIKAKVFLNKVIAITLILFALALVLSFIVGICKIAWYGIN